MPATRWFCTAVCGAVLIVAGPGGSALAQKKYAPGVTDTEIKIGNTMAYSGPASALGTIGRTIAAYWNMVNEKGGINGRRINFISLDDGYSPPKTVEQIRRLVEREEVAFIGGPLGTPTNSAVQKYLNVKKVPQLFLVSAASKWNDPEHYPWSMSFAWGPNYRDEGRIHAQYLLATHPGIKVGVLYQNDDGGKDLLRGLRDGLGERAATVIAAEASFEVTDPTVDSQIVTLHGSGADALIIYSLTPKACAQAIRKSYELGFKSVRLLFSGCTNPEAILKPAGLDRSTGLTALIAMRPVTSDNLGEAGIADYVAFMRRYYPDGRLEENYNVYAYTLAQALEHVLRQAGDDLTRENIMRQASSIKELQLPLFSEGIKINTSASDYATVEASYMSRFDGRHWVKSGELLRGK
jgi:ABC-type branched-subunit amino acid transport system substrate-binding protein